jgi:hypothetical protein
MPARSLWSAGAGIALAGAALAVASGCGSSSESTVPNVRAEVEAAVRDGLTKNDPSWCETGATPRFLEQTIGESDGDPVPVCRLNSVLPGDPFAHEVDFRAVEVDADRAVVTASVTGGAGDGSTIRIELVLAGDRWKFDHLADIRIARAKFDAATRHELVLLGAGETEADCAVERLRRIYDTDELERAFVTGETDGFDAAGALCLSRASLIRFMDLALRKGAPKDVPKVIIECVSRRIAGSLSTGRLRALFGAADELEGYFERLVSAAAKQCAKDAESGLLPERSPA